MKFGVKLKMSVAIMLASVILVVAAVLTWGLGHNDLENWQIIQSVTGKVTVRDIPGWYPKVFAKVWTYPRSIQRYYSGSVEEGGAKDASIRVTFNDGGTAQVSTMVKIQTPLTEPERLQLHKDFGGNLDNLMHSVRAHQINSMKAAAPLMSASEHQSARKAEFTQTVHHQLEHGLYQMKSVEKVLKDQFDEEGRAVTVNATEIITDENGAPIISQESPFDRYGIQVLQFSITDTDYDKMTLDQFEAKKSSYLAAEQSKAKKTAEVQERLMVIEKGKREKAEVEAIANKERAQAVINAEREKEVAELEAAKFVAVAEQKKLQAEHSKLQLEIEAAAILAVAKLNREAAVENAEAIRITAAAEEERIKKAGAITEEKQVLAEIARDRDIGVAKELANIRVPSTIIASQGGQGGSSVMENLINLKLLEATGIIDRTPSVQTPVALPVAVKQ